MKIKNIALSGFALLAVSSQAFAEEKPDTNWYLGISAFEFRSQFDSSYKASGYHAYGGYAFNQHFALEGGYQGVNQGGVAQVRAVGSLPLNDRYFVNAKLGALVRDHDDPHTAVIGMGLGVNLTGTTSLRLDWDRLLQTRWAEPDQDRYRFKDDLYSVGLVTKF